MSDTPETDAAAFDAFDGQGGDEVVFANLARRFERERNKAEAGWLECRNFAQRIVDERDRYKSEVEVITRERDEALNKAHNYEQGYLTHAARADTLEKERDEAREALTLATSEIVEQTFELRQHFGKARQALQKVASLAHGNADKTVCLINLNAIQRIAVAALKHEEAAK